MEKNIQYTTNFADDMARAKTLGDMDKVIEYWLTREDAKELYDALVITKKWGCITARDKVMMHTLKYWSERD